MVVSKLCVAGLNFSETLYYRLLLMNGINWTLILRTVILMELSAKKLLAFIRPVGNSMYGIYDPFGVKLINRSRLSFSHLREHKLGHNFADTVNLSARLTLMEELNNISNAINCLNSTDFIRVIL